MEIGSDQVGAVSRAGGHGEQGRAEKYVLSHRKQKIKTGPIKFAREDICAKSCDEYCTSRPVPLQHILSHILAQPWHIAHHQLRAHRDHRPQHGGHGPFGL